MKFLLVVFAVAVAVSAAPEEAKEKEVTLEQIENEVPLQQHDKHPHNELAPHEQPKVAPAQWGVIPTTRVIPGYPAVPAIGAYPALRTVATIPAVHALPTVRTIPAVGAIPSYRYAAYPYAYNYSPYLKTYPVYRHGLTAAVTRTIPYVY